MEKQKCIIYSNIKATAPNIKIIHKNIIEKIKKMGVLGHPKSHIIHYKNIMQLQNFIITIQTDDNQANIDS